MIDKRMPCHQGCPDRSAECKRDCPKWAAWEEIKKETYAARKQVLDSRPDSEKKKRNANRIKMNKMRGRL